MSSLALVTALAGQFGCSDTPKSQPVAPTPTCSFAVAVNTSQFGPAGGSATAAVTTGASCAWTATSDADWITLDAGTNRTGNGTVPLAVAAFEGTSERTATLTIAQQSLKLTQNGCAIRLSAAELTFDGDGGYADVTISADPACRWSVEGDLAWAGFEPASGAGSGVTRARANRNQTTAPRDANVRVGGQALRLRQQAGGASPAPEPPTRDGACAYSVSPVEGYIPIKGGSGRITVTTSPGCTWTAASQAPQARVIRGESGSGTGTIDYEVDANPSTYQSDFKEAVIAVRWPTPTAGQNVRLLQFAACNLAVSPAITIPAAGGTYHENILVEPAFSCRWRVEGGASWLSILPRPDQIPRGDGSIAVTAEPNPSSQPRTAVITLAEKTVTITQAGR